MTTEPGRLAGILVITLTGTPHQTKPARGQRVTQLIRTSSSVLVIMTAPGWFAYVLPRLLVTSAKRTNLDNRANEAHVMKPFESAAYNLSRTQLFLFLIVSVFCYPDLLGCACRHGP